MIENTVHLRGGRPKGTTAAATRLLNGINFLLIQATRAERRKLILQVAQDVIILTVDGQMAKYGAAKGIVETVKLVFPWITQYQVYAKMRLLKQRGKENEALENGSTPSSGGGETGEATTSND